MTGLSRDDAGRTLRRLSEEIFSSDKMSEKNTGGSGNSRTKLVSFKHALELVMVLPGRIAKETRTKFAGIIQRYMAGDESLVREVQANAQSDAPIQQMTPTIPFDDIVPGASVRLAVIDGVQFLSVRDVIMHICDLSSIRANEKWRLLPDEVKNEVAEFFGNFKFPGKGNKPEPVITFKGVLKLVMLISGQKAALYRSAMVNILQRYYAGDGSLLEEVQANAQSDAPIQQMARASLAAEAAQAMAVDPAPDAQALSRKRRIEELEIEKMQLDITISRREAELDYATKITSTYRDLCQDTVMDTRARLMFKDYYLNLVIPHTQQPAIAAADGSSQPTQPLPPPSRPISLSQVAVQMGLKIPTNDLISLGGTLRKRYEALHGKPPSKHEQLCDGRMTKVNSYFEADRPLVEEVLRTWNV